MTRLTSNMPMGGGGATKSDAHMLSHAFEAVRLLNGKTLREELVVRGFDITTMQFSILTKGDGE